MSKKKAAKRTSKKKPKRKPRNLVVGTLVARSICLVDKQGRPRLQVFDGNGATLIQILDAQGMPRLELVVDDHEGAHICLNSADGNNAVSLAASDRGRGILVNDDNRNPCILLGVGHPEGQHLDSHPKVEVWDWLQRRKWTNWDKTEQIPPEPPV